MQLTQNKKSIGVLIASAVLVIGLFASFQVATADNAVKYASNDAGMTYGSALEAPTLADEPDLISAIATNGKQGYVLKEDLRKAERAASTPDEAMAMMAERERAQEMAFAEALDENGAKKSVVTLAADADKGVFAQLKQSGNLNAAMADMAIGYGVSTEAVEKAFDTAMAATSVAIPVYDKDGVTVIGEYVVY